VIYNALFDVDVNVAVVVVVVVVVVVTFEKNFCFSIAMRKKSK